MQTLWLPAFCTLKLRDGLMLFLLSLLVACGGGSGGGSTPAETNEVEPNNTSSNAQTFPGSEQLRGNVQSVASLLLAETEPNDARLNAGSMLTIDGQDIVTGTLTRVSDDDDFFRLIPREDGTIQLRLNALNNNSTLAITLLDNNGTQQATVSGAGGATLSRSVTANITYFVQISTTLGTVGAVNYELLTTFGSSTNEAAATNDTIANANSNSALTGRAIIAGSVERSSDSTDIFRFTPVQTGLATAHLRLENSTDFNLSLAVIAADGSTVIASSDSSGDELLDFEVSTGTTYYIRVTSNTTGSIAGNAAYDLALFSRSSVDRIDAYRFTATNSGTLAFSLDPNGQILSSGTTVSDLDLFVYSQDFSRRYASTQTGNDNEQVVLAVTTGEIFFIVVQAFNANNNLRYRLSNASSTLTPTTVQMPPAPLTAWQLDSGR